MNYYSTLDSGQGVLMNLCIEFRNSLLIIMKCMSIECNENVQNTTFSMVCIGNHYEKHIAYLRLCV